MSTESPIDPAPAHTPLKGWIWVGIGVLFIGTVVGFFLTAMRPRSDATPPPPPVAHDGLTQDYTVPATRWQDLHDAHLGPNAGWNTNLKMAKPPDRDTFKGPTGTPEDKAATLARRARNRAYDGAPPTIPHRTDGMSVQVCAGCHGQGLVIPGEVSAPRIPHAAFTNCTQCHVPQQGQSPEAGAAAPESDRNAFVGLAAPFGGQRANPAAPPTIPHGTQMREDCMSCHGTDGRLGIRAPHPWRQNCQQCHAPSAALDHRPGGGPEGDLLLTPKAEYPR